jgi:hypothetical protein
MHEAEERFRKLCIANEGGSLPDWMHDEKKIFERICALAGITVERGLELEKLQCEWPEGLQAEPAKVQ